MLRDSYMLIGSDHEAMVGSFKLRVGKGARDTARDLGYGVVAWRLLITWTRRPLNSLREPTPSLDQG